MAELQEQAARHLQAVQHHRTLVTSVRINSADRPISSPQLAIRNQPISGTTIVPTQCLSPRVQARVPTALAWLLELAPHREPTLWLAGIISITVPPSRTTLHSPIRIRWSPVVL